VRHALILLVLVSCASAPVIAPSHPASTQAETGRLAGVAPSLRAGVVAYPDVPPLRTAPPPDHSHHQHKP
jgi:hypothetical protein